LMRLNCLEDLKYCAQTDILDVLPMQTEPGVLVNQGGLGSGTGARAAAVSAV
jgi:hypothetical protein